MSDIPFNVPAGRPGAGVRRRVDGRRPHVSGGPFSKRAGALLQEATGAEEVLLTTSCTAALELSAMLLDLGPDDTVVVPRSRSRAARSRSPARARRSSSATSSPTPSGSTPRTSRRCSTTACRPSCVVHYAGVACDMAGVRLALAGRPDVVVVEDAAHGLFGGYQGEPLGSLGRFASLSFHETKSFVCGEGGALLLNDRADIDRARVLYDKGTDRQAFFLGQVDEYSWRDTGSSFGLSDALAAYLLGQLEAAESIQARRRGVYEGYVEALAGPPRASASGSRSCPRAATPPTTCSTCCCPTRTCGRV